MALSTMGAHIWICWVFFLIDDDLNIYFISPDSQHTRDIKKNSEVACAISNTQQDTFSSKKGVQIYGKAEQLKGPVQLKWFFNMWKDVISLESDFFTYQNYLDKVVTSRVYKITPEKIKWYNEDLDDEEYIFDLE